MMKKKRYGCGTTGELLICDWMIENW
jgi:hypothetical protein